MDKHTETLRNAIQKHLQANDLSWNKLASQSDIIPQTLYAFRSGGGITFENATKVMKVLDLKFEDLK